MPWWWSLLPWRPALLLNLNLARHEGGLTFLVFPLLVLDLTFLSVGFLPAYVFLTVSALVVEDFPAAFVGLVVGTCFLTALVDDTAFAVDVFEGGALRPLAGFVMGDLAVTVFVLDPGLVAGFATVLVVAALEVFEAGLFCKR